MNGYFIFTQGFIFYLTHPTGIQKIPTEIQKR
jgi:hypothetical protein